MINNLVLKMGIKKPPVGASGILKNFQQVNYKL